MIYTKEVYESVKKLLGDLCMAQSRDAGVAYRVSKYKSKDPVFLVEGNGGEMYLMEDGAFELESRGFDIEVPKEKEVTVVFFRFSTKSPARNMTADKPFSDGHYMEVDAGPVTWDGRRIGTLITSRIPQSLYALSSVLRRFIRINGEENRNETFERSLVNSLSSNKIL
ncbi:putative UDP-Gal beta GlcNAC beta 1,4 galactosyltransferase-like protein [Encephalitozoon romaleae SJ-2008]|uniref:UDP-Gal beta GlcNAC beta 1,4 galactosyltransferase-like protein n=1 Tax=Encephalitozoon romaleae (strain SJ-2008) TaxID=1178016 RepID=I7AR89_ENCRO|nr:putative UDP-Gal beta GlcNAC beta 1,4 galactosyltransferase-like protein [Encephalitozoon romaleae SJ-2008]AFN82877.1 putative UDP-Gal beta GlcNAC beta 1,4 galactosyltransferase-like protein [Encephalitozoon romaleae SJ-2008]